MKYLKKDYHIKQNILFLCIWDLTLQYYYIAKTEIKLKQTRKDMLKYIKIIIYYFNMNRP
jgi:hypothetical protein